MRTEFRNLTKHLYDIGPPYLSLISRILKMEVKKASGFNCFDTLFQIRKYAFTECQLPECHFGSYILGVTKGVITKYGPSLTKKEIQSAIEKRPY